MRRLLRAVLPLAVTGSIAAGIAAGCSSGAKHHLIDQPIHVRAVAGDGQATVSWDDTTGAVTFNVYWASDPTLTSDNYGQLPDNGADHNATSPDVIGGLNNGTVYYFVVVGIDKRGAKGKDSGLAYTEPTYWQTLRVVESTAGDALDARLTLNGAGATHAVWSRNPFTRYQIRAADYDGVNDAWGTPAPIDSAFGFSYTPRVAQNVAGDLAAVWRQGNGTVDHVYGAWKPTAANVWSPATEIDGGGGKARNPDVAVRGTLGVAAWAQYAVSTSNTSIVAAVSSGIGSWNVGQVIDVDPFDSGDEPQVGADGAGNALAVWVQGEAVWSARYTSGAWQAPVVVDTNDAPVHPRLAMNAAGDAVAVWQSNPKTGGVDVGAATFTGGAWAPAVSLESNPALDSHAPAVSIDANGKATVVWTQANGQFDAVHGRVYFPGVGWSGDVVVDADPTGSAHSTSVASGPNGNSEAVWTQDQVIPGGPGPTTAVYAARLMATGSNWHPAMIVSDFGETMQPQVAVDDNDVTTVLWTELGSVGTGVFSNRH